MNDLLKKKLEQKKKSILVFDIETSAHYPATGEAVDIDTNFDDYVRHAKVKWVGVYNYKNDEYVRFNVMDIVQKNALKDYLIQPDILCGVNNEEFDYPILYNNRLLPDKYYTQIDCLKILGTDTFHGQKNRGSLMGYSFLSNSLKNIATAMSLETQKGDIDYKIFEKNEWSEDEIKEIEKYLKADVMATKQMLDKLMDYWSPFTNWLTDDNVLNFSWIKCSIASLTYKCDCKTLGVEETYADNPVKVKEAMGGNVITPVCEEARGVWYLDFKSLYPHLIAMFNLCDEVKLTKDIILDKSKKVFNANKLFQTKGTYKIKNQHPICKDIIEKIKLRIHLQETDPDNPMIHCIKILLNSKYGAMRSPTFEKIHTPNIGYDTCWLGQQFQKVLRDEMEKHGYRTIYGDTDSVFVINDYETPFKKFNTYVILNFLKEITKKILKHCPFPSDTFSIDIENNCIIDYIMFPFSYENVIDEETGKPKKIEKLDEKTGEMKKTNRNLKERKGKKKTYVMIFKKDGKDVIKIKGLPIIKNTATVLGVKILNEEINPYIINHNRAKFAKYKIENIIEHYLSKPENLQLLAQRYKCKPYNTYKKEDYLFVEDALKKDLDPVKDKDAIAEIIEKYEIKNFRFPNCIHAQVSKGYFKGQRGIIHLIKNKKFGNAGKTCKYCTVEEAKEHNFELKDYDLSKLNSELEPFIEYEEVEK